MGDVVSFPGSEPDELFLDEMTEDQLRCCLDDLRQRLAELEEQEPEDMDSEDYEVWAEKHEDLEDLVDEILDLLD